MLGKLGNHKPKEKKKRLNWTAILYCTKKSAKNRFDLNTRSETIKILKENTGKSSLTLVFTNIIFGHGTKSASNKSKNKQMKHQNKRLCPEKERAK